MADESVFVCLICVGPSAVLSERTPSSLAWNFSIINCSCIHQIRWNIHKFYYFFSAGWRTAPAAAAESDGDDDAMAAVAATQRTYTLAFPSHTQFIYIFFWHGARECTANGNVIPVGQTNAKQLARDTNSQTLGHTTWHRRLPFTQFLDLIYQSVLNI